MKLFLCDQDNPLVLIFEASTKKKKSLSYLLSVVKIFLANDVPW